MKKTTFLLLVFISITSAHSSDLKQEFISTSQKFKATLDLNEIEYTTKDIIGYSSEGGFIDKYVVDSKTVYVDALLFFEMGKLNYRFYYPTNSGCYIEIDKWSYPEPFTTDGAVLETRYFIDYEGMLFEIIIGDIVSSDFELIDINAILK